MAHSCRWRFPARPGGSSNSGTGRRAGRVRVTASLRSVSGAHPNTAGLGPGFDAALQVSSVIGSNLQKFRDVLGESSDSSSGEVRTEPDWSIPARARGFGWMAAEPTGFPHSSDGELGTVRPNVAHLLLSLSVAVGKLVISRMLSPSVVCCGAFVFWVNSGWSQH